MRMGDLRSEIEKGDLKSQITHDKSPIARDQAVQELAPTCCGTILFIRPSNYSTGRPRPQVIASLLIRSRLFCLSS
jgi:hypothetical protein